MHKNGFFAGECISSKVFFTEKKGEDAKANKKGKGAVGAKPIGGVSSAKAAKLRKMAEIEPARPPY